MHLGTNTQLPRRSSYSARTSSDKGDTVLPNRGADTEHRRENVTYNDTTIKIHCEVENLRAEYSDSTQSSRGDTNSDHESNYTLATQTTYTSTSDSDDVNDEQFRIQSELRRKGAVLETIPHDTTQQGLDPSDLHTTGIGAFTRSLDDQSGFQSIT